jgi:hypothetical protein
MDVLIARATAAHKALFLFRLEKEKANAAEQLILEAATPQQRAVANHEHLRLLHSVQVLKSNVVKAVHLTKRLLVETNSILSLQEIIFIAHPVNAVVTNAATILLGIKSNMGSENISPLLEKIMLEVLQENDDTTTVSIILTEMEKIKLEVL